MREVARLQLELGQTPIEKIKLSVRSRDDIPAILRGLQHIYVNPVTREELFTLLEGEFLPEVNLRVGRPGMDIWRVVVLGVLKQGLGCDYDRLHSLANSYMELRQMLGHGEWGGRYEYGLQNIVDNVSLLRPELLNKIGEIVVRSGHEVSKKKPGEGLRGRCDSFPANTDVEYPTDVKLLWDAVRSLIRHAASASRKNGLSGWRQEGYLLRKGGKLCGAVSTSRRRKKAGDAGIREYVEFCGRTADKAGETLCELLASGCPRWRIERVSRYLGHARRQIDQVERRLLKGEVIPAGEKVYSVFEPHTRWIAKGKAGVPAEFGVPVCVVEDQYQFILNHRVMWSEEDVDVAVGIVEDTLEKHPCFASCSFDKGFWSPQNRERLDELLETNVMPKKGRVNRGEEEREGSEEFARARRQHPAVESAINALNHKGLSRVRDHGARGFARSVALSVLAANVHRLGTLLRKEELEKRRRKPGRRFLVAA